MPLRLIVQIPSCYFYDNPVNTDDKRDVNLLLFRNFVKILKINPRVVTRNSSLACEKPISTDHQRYEHCSMCVVPRLDSILLIVILIKPVVDSCCKNGWETV